MMNVVRLPTEIWRLILRQATYVPDLLSTSWDCDPSDRIWESWYSEKLEHDLELDEQLGTKSNIVQVCREWKEIGTEFLYEAIQISTITEDVELSRLGNLAEAFTASAASSQSAIGSVSYGWWTKRITFRPNSLQGDLFEHLATLLEHCHNLEILSIAVASYALESDTNLRLLRLLESRLSHSLRRFDNYLDTDRSNADVTPCISGLTSLSVVMQTETPNPLDARVAFESITSLTMLFPDFIESIPSQWTLPALKNLSLWNFASQDVEALASFAKRHQDTLLHLHISTMRSSTDQLPHLLSNAPYINSLALEKVDLRSLGKWRQTNSSSNSSLLPKLTYLGISYDDNKLDASPWTDDSMIDVLGGGLFPNLKIIRLLREYNPTSSESVWPKLVEQCTNSGVRLEDRRGVLIRSESRDP